MIFGLSRLQVLILIGMETIGQQSLSTKETVVGINYGEPLQQIFILLVIMGEYHIIMEIIGKELIVVLNWIYMTSLEM
jgi:hypothetical protein